MPPRKLDSFGRPVGEPPIDKFLGRCGGGEALMLMAPLVPKDCLQRLMDLYVPTALNDRSDHVRNVMRRAALALINRHGKVSDHPRLN